MTPKCRDAVQAAAKTLGKTLTQAQLDSIESNLSQTMRSLARQDPQGWAALPYSQRLQAAGRALAEDIKGKAARKAELATMQVEAAARVADEIGDLQAAFKGQPGHSGTRAEALNRHQILTNQQIGFYRRELMGGLMDLIEAAGNTKGVGLGRAALMRVFDAENPAMTRDVAREIFANADGHTGNAYAQMGARAWLDTIEGARQRFNAAGGDVGKLEYGYVPQPHDAIKVKKAGADRWADEVLPLLDRRRYLREDGTLMSDAEVKESLKAAWDTIQSEGVNKMVPGQFKGSGKKANAHSDSRQIHLADGDAWLTYNLAYGRGSMFDAMMSHVSSMAKDTVLVERYGPDPVATMKLQFDLTAKADGTQLNNLSGKTFSVEPQTYWMLLSGQTGTPVNERLSRTGEFLRNIQTAAKLGGAVISSVTDLGTIAVTAGYNRLPYWQLIKDIGATARPDWLGGAAMSDFMSTHGMIAESLADGMNRWSGDHIGTSWSGKMANNVMRWSLMNAWTDSMRQGFTLSMNAGMGRLAKLDWASLKQADRAQLERAGFTAADWSALQQVPLTQFKGRELLVPQSIPDRALAAKVFSFIQDEAEYAVINPDLTTRAITTWGGKEAGTAAGELARVTMQFKSFPISMVTRHWQRMMETEGAINRVAYGSAMLLTTTALGAIAAQAKEMLRGKDPIDMTGPHAGGFWLKALAQGGGLSIVGDLFLTDPSNDPGGAAASLLKNVAGPTVGSAGELVAKVGIENVWQAAAGKDTHWEAEVSRWVQSNAPAGNLWWLKPMVDHAFMNAANEAMSPGYLTRMKQRARKEWGQEYWWDPSATTPNRPPQYP